MGLHLGADRWVRQVPDLDSLGRTAVFVVPVLFCCAIAGQSGAQALASNGLHR